MTSTARWVTAITAAALIAGACAGDSTDAPVATLEALATAVPRATLVEELRLDAHTEVFSSLSRVEVGPRGEIVVPQPQDMQLLIYDDAGARVAAVGRTGDGPGEFRSLGHIGWVADTLWIFDGSLRRLTWLAPGGELLRVQALPQDLVLEDPDHDAAPAYVSLFTPWVVQPDGDMFDEVRATDMRDGVMVGIAPPVLARLPAGSRTTEVVARPPTYEDERWTMHVDGSYRLVPFMMPPWTAGSRDGARFASLHAEPFAGDAGAVTLTAHSTASAAAGFIRDYPFRGEPIPGSVRDSVLATFVPTGGPTRRGGASDLEPRFQAVARERMPAVYAPVTGFRLGLDDTFWLDLRETGEGRVTLILDARGEPIGAVLLPAHVVIRQASRTHLWVTERDEFGLNSVVRYRYRLSAVSDHLSADG
jgi:hypothetical protein